MRVCAQRKVVNVLLLHRRRQNPSCEFGKIEPEAGEDAAMARIYNAKP